MFNRIKFVINKIISQNLKNKKRFNNNKRIINNKINHVSVRNFSSLKPPNDPSNIWIIIASITCSSLFLFKKK